MEDEHNEKNDKQVPETNEPETAAESSDGQGVDFVLTREQLLETMNAFAQKHNCQPDPKTSRIQFGMVGFPNVGKSSGKYNHRTVQRDEYPSVTKY